MVLFIGHYLWNLYFCFFFAGTMLQQFNKLSNIEYDVTTNTDTHLWIHIVHINVNFENIQEHFPIYDVLIELDITKRTFSISTEEYTLRFQHKDYVSWIWSICHLRFTTQEVIGFVHFLKHFLEERQKYEPLVILIKIIKKKKKKNSEKITGVRKSLYMYLSNIPN